MKHLLDTTSADLRQWLTAHGHPGYRAAQIERWVLEKRAADFAAMSDLPVELRQQLASRVSNLHDAGRQPPPGRRRHREAAAATGRRRADRVRAAAGRRAAHDLHQHPGRLRHGLRVLRQRPGRRRSQSDHGRNRRADAPPPALAAGRRTAQPHRGDGHGRAAGQSRSPAAGAATSPATPRGWASARGASRSRRSACRRPSTA